MLFLKFNTIYSLQWASSFHLVHKYHLIILRIKHVNDHDLTHKTLKVYLNILEENELNSKFLTIFII